jgi:septum formation protein
MILSLSGRAHEVHTRFLLAAPEGVHEETVITRVTFRPLTEARARAYAQTGEGLDKAGGYAVQGLASAFVSRIEGSYSNVVGLPACEVMMALEARGMVSGST